MEWDQYIFKKISQWVRYCKKPKIDDIEIENTVFFEDLKPELQYLAYMLSGRQMSLHTAEDTGGWKGGSFFLPKEYSHAKDRAKNRDFYLFRIFYMYGITCLGYEVSDSTVDEYELSLSNSSKVIDKLSDEFPNFKELHERVLSEEINYQSTKLPNQKQNLKWIYGKWYKMSEKDWAEFHQLIDPLKKNTVTEDKEQVNEVEGNTVEEVNLLVVNTKEQEEYTLTHNFEKIETIDSFSGRWRNFDGSDEMDDHHEAVNEIKMDNLVRVDSPVHSIYKTDFAQTMGMIYADAHVNHFDFSYPEWQQHKKSYRDNYCKIIYRKESTLNEKYVNTVIKEQRREITKLRKLTQTHLCEYFMQKKSAQGDEPDLDALVINFADRKMGLNPDERVYISKRKKTKDIAILVLTDCSLSTDGYMDNRRILDIEREALIICGQVWSGFDIKFQFDGFSSHTHTQCFYTTYKAFHEDWDKSKYKVGAMASVNYTRIGAALRHASFLLDKVNSDKKWLILLSDGKPNDYDTYEGNYGIYDVKKAVYEAKKLGIDLSAIAIDSKAKFYFPKMFGLGSFEILSPTHQLSETLLKFYVNILK